MYACPICIPIDPLCSPVLSVPLSPSVSLSPLYPFPSKPMSSQYPCTPVPSAPISPLFPCPFFPGYFWGIIWGFIWPFKIKIRTPFPFLFERGSIFYDPLIECGIHTAYIRFPSLCSCPLCTPVISVPSVPLPPLYRTVRIDSTPFPNPH